MLSSQTKLFFPTLSAAAAVVTIAFFSNSAPAQVEGPQPVRVLVRAEVKNGAVPPLTAANLTLDLAGRPVPVTRFAPVQQPTGLSGRNRGQKLEVAVLIDDGLRSNFGTNLQDVEKFVTGVVSPTTSVGLGYMRNGSVFFPTGFSNDPEVERKAVRLPISAGGINGSPYFCLQDLIKHWPTQTGAPRVVLMITNGVDRYNGSVSPLNQNSPYVDNAISDAQRANIPVYSIYFGPRQVNSGLGSFSGQGYLGKVADQTGGMLFNQGTINPPSIAPYFRQFQKALSNTYIAEFLAANRRLDRLKVSSNAPGVKLYTQQQVQATDTGNNRGK